MASQTSGRRTQRSTSHRRQLGVVGVGEVASAIVDGLGADASFERIHLSPRSARTATALAARHQHVVVCPDNQSVIDRSDVVLLCIRPDIVGGVLAALNVPPSKVLISAVAGWSRAQLRELLPRGPQVVRVIPLPAVRDRRGITAVFPPHPAARELFNDLGGVAEIDQEEQFSAFSAATATISSHLSFLTTTAEWMADKGVAEDDADQFVRAIYAGIGSSLVGSNTRLGELVGAHETPGGINEQLRGDWYTHANANATCLEDALEQIFTRVRPE